MEKFIKLLVVLFLFMMAYSACGGVDGNQSELQLINSRLKLVEDSLAMERLSRRKDVNGLMGKLSQMETLLEKLSSNTPLNQDVTGLQQERDHLYIDKYEREIIRLMRSVKHAFSMEKKINMRLRREILDELKDHELLKNVMEGMLKKILDMFGSLDKTLCTKSDHDLSKNMIEGISKLITEKFASVDRTLQSNLKPVVKKSDLAKLNENCLQDLSRLDDIQISTKNLVTMSDLSTLTEFIQEMKSEFQPHIIKSRSCKDLYDRGFKTNGVYEIYLYTRPVQVYCDQETDGGGWTVFQRRQDGSVDFYRNWDDYKKGFGDIEGEFWLGNDKIADLTMDCCHELRVDIGDFEGNVAYAKYSTFSVGSESSLYKLEVDGYSGNAGDSLKVHNGMKFTTKDSDNDEAFFNCAEDKAGAWWYENCSNSNLNGKYMTGGVRSIKGIIWYHWKYSSYSYSFSEMKLR